MLLRDNETLSFTGEVPRVKLQIGPEYNSGCLNTALPQTGLGRQDWVAGKLKEVVTLSMWSEGVPQLSASHSKDSITT